MNSNPRRITYVTTFPREYSASENRRNRLSLVVGIVLGLVIPFLIAAGFTNLGPFSSFLYSPLNPLADGEGIVFFDTIDELEAADGSGLDDLDTIEANVGARLSFVHATSGATLQYRLASGSPSEDLPWIVLPDDAGTSGKYFALEAHWLRGIPLLPSQTDTTKFYRIYASVDVDGDVIFKVDDTAITITD
jgi:hypothetical protein